MDFSKIIKPMEIGPAKMIMLGLAIIIVALGTAIFSFTYILAISGLTPTFYGMVIVWIGSMAFFYSIITEEHTLKELFLRQGYFFTGLLAMIMGMVFISLSGMAINREGISLMEFGVLLIILGAGLIILSAQRTYDYSARNALFAMFAGLLLALGGIMAGSLNVSYGGIFIVILSAVWFGLRDMYAE